METAHQPNRSALWREVRFTLGKLGVSKPKVVKKPLKTRAAGG